MRLKTTKFTHTTEIYAKIMQFYNSRNYAEIYAIAQSRKDGGFEHCALDSSIVAK